MPDGSDKAGTRDLCLTCGAIIEQPVFMQGHGPFTAMIRQTHCGDCGFMNFFKEKTLKPCPYRLPWQRPTPDNKAPKSYLDALDAYRSQSIGEAES
jgi:ribosomal protein S27AE